jgi:hypothetical protein
MTPPNPAGDEPWEWIIDGPLDPQNEWHADGSWMILEGIDPPDEVQAMKDAAIAAAKLRQAVIIASRG